MSDQSVSERTAGPNLLQSQTRPAERFDPLSLRSATMSPMAADELSMRVQRLLAPAKRGRRKIWDFDAKLHCSIIGTCLSTGELRQVLLKLSHQEAAAASEHDLHASGVLIAGSHRDGGKLLHKALDRRHRLAINQFDRATAPEVRTLWQKAMQRGEVPGAYWATLTHPATNDGLVREVFSEVHMLSHLVGAANRADIRRLRQLETEKAELEAKVARQQQQLRDAIVERDATIRVLTRTLEEHLMRDRGAESPSDSDSATWAILAADLKRRLTASESRRERAERRFDETRSALATERNAREASEWNASQLRDELAAIEANLAEAADPVAGREDARSRSNMTLLYVGGRQSQIGHLRALSERTGAVFLHHDGGVEERGGLLPGLVSRADVVMFPVDCISHSAMSLVKRLCQQAGKSFVPLRSTGLAPLWAGLHGLQRDPRSAAAD
jgi:hypothetical protein